MASSSSPSPSLLLLSLLVALLLPGWGPHGGGATLVLDLHHRFSDKVRSWAEANSWDVGHWPQKGSLHYYAALAEHDRALLRGRGLAEGGGGSGTGELTFADGNITLRVDTLGFLHYAVVELGNPSVSFLVALDTGSDLFWLPCDCQSCAPTSSPNYGINVTFDIFRPSLSSTNKKVPCNSSLCDLQSTCSGTPELCPYNVTYLSANTTTSGIIMEDVLHLTTEDALQKPVEAKVTFGCGQVQTGSFLRSAAPNGLLGLGREKISIPSTLASSGLTSDSFSMCFGPDGIGRISFGDKGNSDQEETPFNQNKSHPTYIINVTGVRVGNKSFPGDFNAFVDSGTSFTILADPFYTTLTKNFDSQAGVARSPPDSNNPFEYCYPLSPNQKVPDIPDMSLIMNGGSEFPVLRPIVIVSSPVEDQYCLAVIKSRNVNIIGQNLMTGLRIVFDREKLVLGWNQFNCYDSENSNTMPINPRNSSALPPSAAVRPTSYTPEATKQTSNTSSGLPSSRESLHFSSFILSILLLFLSVTL